MYCMFLYVKSFIGYNTHKKTKISQDVTGRVFTLSFPPTIIYDHLYHPTVRKLEFSLLYFFPSHPGPHNQGNTNPRPLPTGGRLFNTAALQLHIIPLLWMILSSCFTGSSITSTLALICSLHCNVTLNVIINCNIKVPILCKPFSSHDEIQL